MCLVARSHNMRFAPDKRREYFDVFYLQVNDPASGIGWWFRYSVLMPRQGVSAPYAAVWCVEYNPLLPFPSAFKDVYDVSEVKEGKDSLIQIGNWSLDMAGTCGSVCGASGPVKWDIGWSEGGDLVLHYPMALYRLPFPRSKVTYPCIAATGSGTVRHGSREYLLKDALVHVGHVFGRSHSKSWIWLHAHDASLGACGNVLEIAASPIADGIWGMVCCLRLDGLWVRGLRWFRLKRPEDILNLGGWRFKVGAGRYLVDGFLELRRSMIAGVGYDDTDGSKRFCYNTKVADLRARILSTCDRRETEILLRRNVGFEVALPREVSGIPIIL